MSQIIPYQSPAAPARAVRYTDAQVDLVRRTYAKDCDQNEFELFWATSNRLGLDPFKKQIYAVVYGKDDPKKRKMSLIVGIDGYRKMASECGDYRPDDAPTVFESDDDLKSPTNPQGLISATVKCYKLGADKIWHAVAGTAYWEEFAPLKEEWAAGEDGRRAPTGRFVLDRGGKWASMPRLMLAKCAEAQAIRRGWPDGVGGLYVEDELARANADEQTATERLEAFAANQRLAQIGGGGGVPIQWSPGQSIEEVPMGQFADRAAAFIAACPDIPTLESWRSINTYGLRLFWTHHASDALEIKRLAEGRAAELAARNQGA